MHPVSAAAVNIPVCVALDSIWDTVIGECEDPSVYEERGAGVVLYIECVAVPY